MEKFMDYIKKSLNVRPSINALNDGSIIRKIIGTILQVLAFVLGIIIIVYWFKMWPFINELSFISGLGFVIWQFGVFYASLLSLKVLYLRGSDMKKHPDSDYVIVPIIAESLKIYGEMLFFFLAAISLPTALLIWFGGQTIINKFQVIDMGSIFLSGITTFFTIILFSISSIIVTRFLSEWIFVFFSIADDLNIMRRNKIGKK